MSDLPTSTYRLQLTPAFGFAEAAAIAPYLAGLGISHAYLSPILQAVPGSEHGYDVADHDRIDAERGGEPGFRAMAETFHRHGLGVIVDIVPNHMAFQSAKVHDVVERGRDSPYADWFDWTGDRLVVPGEGEPNYRRFFDISGLIGLRQEDPAVFAATHGLLFRLHDEGLIDGFRVDHVDGLADPGAYLEQLRDRFDGWVIVEKILIADERLPEGWPGTTGYETAVAVDGLFLDPAGEQPLTALFIELTGGPATFGGVARAGKAHVIEYGLAPEVNRLHRALCDLMPQADPDALRVDLVRSLIDFPFYRSYDKAIDQGWLEFGIRFQQTTSALMARGLEDTAFYRWSRLVSRNEVGGEPGRFAVEPEEFHRDCNTRFGTGLTTLSTHDTKRQEDVRARLAVLSEMPDEWAEFVRPRCDGSDFDYLMWQTLVGAWPLDGPRLTGYLTKAMREAKTHTDWLDQNAEYERAVLDRATKALADEGVAEFAASLAPYERSNVLSQKLVQLTMPGVPDTYQGCELTGYALVDPDNRRPVDYAGRAALLAALDAAESPPDELLADLDAEKLLVTARTLRLRAAHPEWFASFHVPLTGEGPAADHVIAFRRGDAVTVATRLPRGLERAGGWRDTSLPLEGRWRDVLTGRSHAPLHDLLAILPVALLVPEE